MYHSEPGFDVTKAHIHFAMECFNFTWTLLEKPTRTPAEDESMVLCALASLWHWTQRKDCTDLNLSIAHWQAPPAWALTGTAPNPYPTPSPTFQLSKAPRPLSLHH